MGVESLSDSEIVKRVRAGDRALFEILMRRHNQQIYRAARAIVKNETEVEDVMQQAYINAYLHLDQFEERSQFSTWLTRIAVNEAIGRREKTKTAERISERLEENRVEKNRVEKHRVEKNRGIAVDTFTSSQPSPEHQAYARELQRVLEQAVDELPDNYRTVFMLRDIEGLSTSETGEGLGLGEEAVKTRLHRARAMIRRSVASRIGEVAAGAFTFQAPRCDRVVAYVLEQLNASAVSDDQR
jgi:RNA polymerase sigma-70 factor, ECF subfamily